MPRISTSPPEVTVMRLEQRKSAALSLAFVDAAGRPVDLTGCSVVLVIGERQRGGGYTVVLDLLGSIQNPTTGLVRFNIQAADLDLAAQEYDYSVTLRTVDRYSAVVMKGSVEILENPDPSVAGTYPTEAPAMRAIVELLGSSVSVTVTNVILPAEGGVFTAAEKQKLALIEDGAEVNSHDISTMTEGVLDMDRIADGAIDTTKIADLAVTNAKIANGTIADAKMASGQSASKLTTGTLPIARIADGAITEVKLAATGKRALPVGGIFLWPGTTLPTNTLLCDGTAISRTTYAALFAVLGTSYGAGDGSTTFNLPNLRGRVPVGQDSSQTEFDAMGETGGAKTVALSVAQLPAHSHPLQGHVWGWGSSGTISTPGSPNAAATPSTGNAIYTFQGQAGWNSTLDTGSGSAHQNLQPYLVLRYLIQAL